MITTINIVYPPGTGGNHLANLISTDKKYSLTVDWEVYNNSNKEVHQTVERKNTDVSINLMHMGEFIYKCQTKQLPDNSTNILILLPPYDNTNLAFQRLTYWGKQYNDKFIYHENALMYSRFVVSKFLTGPWTVIDSSLLFSNDVNYIVRQLAIGNINIDIDVANVYHKKWIDKIKDYLSRETQLTT